MSSPTCRTGCCSKPAGARAWHDAGHAWRVAVNLSTAQCLHNNLLLSVQNALAVSGLPAGCLEREVTRWVPGWPSTT
ncbi:hypothetical protein [Janthinobacterium sp. 75]|uniref:hypothetical protein n=1 Tax=Janthinobacterium sp. 75 TaxID=2135628 RepID=UPI0010645BF3|nr:hypothetical protein [Janthinobacterium sp. 75]